MRHNNAKRSGHMPSYLRDAFITWLEAGAQTEHIEIDGETRPVRWLIGRLWNCTDTLPGWVVQECDALDLGTGTYASAARKIATRQSAALTTLDRKMRTTRSNEDDQT